MSISNFRQVLLSFNRLRKIIRTFAKHGLQHLVDRSRSRRYFGWLPFRSAREQAETWLSVPERLRLVFEELGPTFIKLGQLLSTRPDLLSEIIGTEYVDRWVESLKKLRDHATPFPVEDAKKIVEKELKKSCDQIFQSFDETPIAAASVSQVHAATLQDGSEIVVKIQRPEIERQIETDLTLMMQFARRIERQSLDKIFYKPTEIIREFSRSIRRELNFTMEAANTDRFRRQFEKDDRIKIPKVHWDFTTHRVLTLEKIDGIPIDRVREISDQFDQRKLAEMLIDFFYHQIFRDGFFHSDPHPGNIFVMENGRIGLVDFGQVSRIPKDLHIHLNLWFVAIAKRDADRVVRAYQRMGILGDPTNLLLLKTEISEILEQYANLPVHRIRISHLLNEVISISLRHHVQFPSPFLMLAKTAVTLEAIVIELHDDFQLIAFSRNYADKFLEQQIRSRNLTQRAIDNTEDLFGMISDLPTQVNQILRKVQNGQIRVQLEHEGLDLFLRDFDRVGNRIAFSMIIAALIIGSSIILHNQQFDYKWLIGLSGYFVAGFFGVGLIISILRSGRIF